MFRTHGTNSTDLAEPDKALEQIQIFELFVPKNKTENKKEKKI